METATTTQEYRVLPLNRVIESKLNQRQDFDGIEELAETIRQHGVIQPVLVRPVGDTWEVVAGHRRFRAARQAGSKEIPATIRELSDEQVIELSLLENVQRAGIHPLEEARGYQDLIQKAQLTQDQIAARIGRSERYLSQRLALLRLIKPAHEALLARKISVTQGVLIARLQPPDQKRALEIIFDRWRGTMTTRQLAEWIEREVYVRLRGAPFDAKECQGCPRRSGSAPDLFSDVRRPDTCTDPGCYGRKVQAHIEATVKSFEASGQKFLRTSTDYFSHHPGNKRLPAVLYRDDYREIEAGTKPCAAALPAVVVHGRDQLGHLMTVCASRLCRQHSPSQRRAKAATAARKYALQRNIQAETNRRILAAILEKIRAPLSQPDLRLVLTAWFENAGHERRMALCRQERIDPVIVEAQGGHKDYHKGFAAYIARLETGELHRLLLGLALISHVLWSDPHQKDSPLQRLASERKINVAAIRQQVAGEMGGANK